MNQDQAKNLRELVKNENRCKTIFFMNGKEKVGQTMTITNLATLLSENNYKTLILDSGIGFLRTDTLLNVIPKYGITSAIDSSDYVEKMTVSIADNLKVLYTRALFEDIESSSEMLIKLQECLSELKEKFDFILVDLEQIKINSIKDIFDYETEVLFTLNTGDLDCLKKTYVMIKEIESYTDVKKINIIVNKVVDLSLSDDFYERLRIASDKFLGVRLEKIGYISKDDKVPESLKKQVPITKLYKDSKVSNEFKEIFSNIWGENIGKKVTSKIIEQNVIIYKYKNEIID